jgi:hypothetical protein
MRIVSPLPGGAVGEPYAVALAHEGGSESCSWTLLAGNLPLGLTLNPTGHIAGVPTDGGNARFAIQAKEIDVPSPATASATFTLVIAPASLAITTTSLSSGQVGVAYSETLEASGGVPPYSWSATGLAPRLGCSSTGVISGTPTAAGTDSVVVTVVDSG